MLSTARFQEQFERFLRLIAAHDRGHAFTNFHEGVAGVWESYKPRLRNHALGLLGAGGWSKSDIGSGVILGRTIAAIEIQDSRINLTNNLVFWQNRFGHTNREHRSLLDSASSPKLSRELEGLLFSLFREEIDEGAIFDRLSELLRAKYPLLAYLYFLKDMDRFAPIQPTTYDRAFRALGIDLVTLKNCSWENYRGFNQALEEVRMELRKIDSLSDARLIDAHSFCWLLERLDEDGPNSRSGEMGRILGGRQTSIIDMRYSVENTVRNSNGQIVQRTVKNKELNMTTEELDRLLDYLLDDQGGRCALTGIRFNYHGPNADKNLLPSLDRIDSDGHYELGNLQIVCRFINFWKGSSDNAEFRKLLGLVRNA